MNLTRTTSILALAIALTAAPASAARLQPSSDLLLPWFEVDLDPAGATTLFAVGNASEQPVEVLATVSTNWGIPILDVPFTLQPDEIRTVDLRAWLQDGGDPRRAVAAVELAHVAAAASGQVSPRDRLYYGSEVRPGVAVGSVTLRTRGARRDALWGDWFVLDGGGSVAHGAVLVDIDRSGSHSALCRQHLLRYSNGGGFDAGSEVIVWRDVVGRPLASPDGVPPGIRLVADAAAVSEPGGPEESRQIELLALDRIAIADLGLRQPFGALRIETAEDIFIGVLHRGESRGSVSLQAYCAANACDSQRTALRLNVQIEGQAAGTAPGPLVDSGSRLTWTLTVANTGELPVRGIEIDGLEASCPGRELEAGESMECLATQKALSDPQTVALAVRGRSSCGDVSETAAGYYEGVLVDIFPPESP